MTRDLDFGIGGDLAIKDIFSLSSIYGYNFLNMKNQTDQLMHYNHFLNRTRHHDGPNETCI